MSVLNHKLAMMLVAAALDAVAGPVKVEEARPPAPAKPTRTPGNPSGHTPHQGKREMARRAKRIAKEDRT
jgi:hypothetical protein